MKRPFRRLALVVLSGAMLGAGAPPVAAAPATHYSFSSLGAMALMDQVAGDVVTESGIFVDMVDPATGDAQLNYQAQTARLDEYGNYVPISMANSFSTVHLDVDNGLTSAHASGTILVDSCQLDESWFCIWGTETQVEAYLDVTWTSTSKALKTHRVDLAAVTHTSRVIMKTGSAFRLAVAVATLDGISMGTSVAEAGQTRIFDSTNSSVEIYHGGSDLPGTVMAALPATPQGADPASKPVPPGSDIDSEYIQGAWYEPYSMLFYAASMGPNPGQANRVVEASFYGTISGVDAWGNPIQLKYVEATGTGTFDLDNRLDSASFSGTLVGMACTNDWGWWICLDGAEIPIDIAMTGTGETNSTIDTSIQTGIDGTKYQSHLKSSYRYALVAGTIDGQAVGTPDNAWMELYSERGTIYIP